MSSTDFLAHIMFPVLIDQIEHLGNSSINSYSVEQVNVRNEIFDFAEDLF